jgi:hypothetical protein
VSLRLAAAAIVCGLLAAHAPGVGTGSMMSLDMPPGSCVRAGTGTLVLRARSGDAAVSWRMINFFTGDEVATGSLLPDHGSFEIPLRLERFGVYRVELSAGASTTPVLLDIAAIPDNRRSQTSTTSPFAMGCYFGMRFSEAELREAVRLAALAGVAASREEIRWDLAEPRRGEFQWGQFDRAVDACVRHHIGVLGLVDYWGAYHASTGTMTDQAVKDFAGYAAECAKRFRPGGVLARERGWSPASGISEWEIWNEPATFWSFSAADFGVLSAAAFRAIKAVDPAARVFFANASQAFDTQALAAMGGQAFDGVAPHFYMPPRSPADGGLVHQLRLQREFYEQRELRVPLWITEIGWYADRSRERQAQQAVYLAQSYLLALAAGYERVFWYNFVNDNADDSVMHYGLLTRPRLEPRLGYGAFAGLVSALEGQRFVGALDLGRFVHGLVFAGEGALRTVALWAERGDGRLIPASPLRGSLADLFGNKDHGPLNAIQLSSAPAFLTVPESALRALEGARIEGIAQVEFDIERTTGALSAGRTLTLVARNFTRQGVRLTPRAQSADVELSPVPPMDLAAYSSATASLIVRGVRPNPDNRWTVRLSAELGEAGRVEREVLLADRVATRGTPTIDGDLSDWCAARPLRLDSPDQVVGISPWMDWNLSATYWLQWDTKYLYFAALVHDNVHCQPHSGDLIWEGDSWQLAFDAKPGHAVAPGHEPGEGKYCYGLALTALGPQAAAWQGNRDASLIKVSVRNLGVTALDSAGGSPGVQGLAYECAIPADLLAPLRMETGATFGFSVLLNDNDGGGRMGWMESSSGIGTGFNPAAFDLFELR